MTSLLTHGEAAGLLTRGESADAWRSCWLADAWRVFPAVRAIESLLASLSGLPCQVKISWRVSSAFRCEEAKISWRGWWHVVGLLVRACIWWACRCLSYSPARRGFAGACGLHVAGSFAFFWLSWRCWGSNEFGGVGCLFGLFVGGLFDLPGGGVVLLRKGKRNLAVVGVV